MKRSAQIILLKLDLDPIFLSRESLFQGTIQFPWVESRFSKVQSAKLNTDEAILMAGTEYFGQAAVEPHDHIPINTMRKSHNHTLSRHCKSIHNHALSSHV